MCIRDSQTSERFVFDLYRRLIQMFGSVVMDVPDEVFEAVIEAQRKVAGVKTDAEMNAEDWKVVTKQFKQISKPTHMRIFQKTLPAA